MSPRIIAAILGLVSILLAPSAHAWLTYANFPIEIPGPPLVGSGRWTPGAGPAPGVLMYTYNAAGEPGGLAGTGAARVAAAHTTWNNDRGSQISFAQVVATCTCPALGDGTNCVGWDATETAIASTLVRSGGAGTLIEFDICI